MPRQRLVLPTGWRTRTGTAVMAFVGLALIYGGLVVLALALGVAPHSLQRDSGYQTVYRELAGIDPRHWATATKVIVTVGGILTLLFALVLAWAQRLLPKPSREPLLLTEDELGTVTVSPRAIERAAEAAALSHRGVRGARARLTQDGLVLVLNSDTAATLSEQLRGARDGADRALRDAGVPQASIRVSIARFTSPSTRETLR